MSQSSSLKSDRFAPRAGKRGGQNKDPRKGVGTVPVGTTVAKRHASRPPDHKAGYWSADGVWISS